MKSYSLVKSVRTHLWALQAWKPWGPLIHTVVIVVELYSVRVHAGSTLALLSPSFWFKRGLQSYLLWMKLFYLSWVEVSIMTLGSLIPPSYATSFCYQLSFQLFCAVLILFRKVSYKYSGGMFKVSKFREPCIYDACSYMHAHLIKLNQVTKNKSI